MAARFVDAWPLDLVGGGCGFDDGACRPTARAAAAGCPSEVDSQQKRAPFLHFEEKQNR